MAQATEIAWPEEHLPPPSPPAECPDCNAIFPGYQAMLSHMEREYRRSNWNTHIHCPECKKYTPTHDALKAHLRRNHPRDQDLNCPTCGKHFVRVTEMSRHLEHEKCGLDRAKLQAENERKMKFAKELEARHRGDYDVEVEAAYMSRNSALRPKAEDTVRPYPVQFDPYETHQVDVYWYHQNVYAPRRMKQHAALEEARNDVRASKPANPTPAPAIEAAPSPSQSLDTTTTAPISIEEWKQGIPRAGDTLLDDFDPEENRKLPLSLIDYYDPSDDESSGRPGPWSVYFNPWGNDDDLIGLSSRASSRASSPAASRVFPNRDLSSAATVREKPLAPTVVTLSDVSADTLRVNPPAKNVSAMPKTTSQAVTPVKASAVRAAATPKQISTTLGMSHGRPSPQPSTVAPPKPSQAVTPVEAAPTTVPPVQQTSQALTPAKRPGAMVPVRTADQAVLDDYDDVKQAIVNDMARHNPKNPNFRVQNYYQAVIGKYKCPIPQCYKSFKKPGQFEHHIGTHMVEKKTKYPCPGCKDMFDSKPALIAHTESQSIRCNFRYSKQYPHFLSQALAGMVDVVGEDPIHGIMQYAISKEAKKNFGAQGPDNDDARRSRSDEFKAATAALEERAIDEEEEKRSEWEAHERKTEALLAKDREKEQQEQAKQAKQVIKEEQVKVVQTMTPYRYHQATEPREITVQEQERERIRKAGQQRARAAEEERARKVKEAEQERARAERDHERKIEQERAQQVEKERIEQVRLEFQRKVQQGKARADEQHIQQAKEAQNRAIKQEESPESQWVHVIKKQVEVLDEDDMKRIEDEENRLSAEIERLREQRRKLQQKKEKQPATPTQMELDKENRREEEARVEAARREKIRLRLEAQGQPPANRINQPPANRINQPAANRINQPARKISPVIEVASSLQSGSDWW